MSKCPECCNSDCRGQWGTGCPCCHFNSCAGPIKRPCAAVSLVRRPDDKILCVWNKRYGGWAMPGGLVEEGETPQQAQARELREETGLETIERLLIHEAPAEYNKNAVSRGSYVYVFGVVAEGIAREREDGCAVTWLTVDEFLKWSPFADFYRGILTPSAQT